MTTAQGELAIGLLRESLDWIGVLNLTPEQEGHAEELQRRIDRLLGELGAMPGMVTRREQPRDLYEIILRCRDRLKQAAEEKDAARLRVNELMQAGAELGPARSVAIRRLELAFAQWEAAEHEMFRAEADYSRSLQSGGHQCTG